MDWLDFGGIADWIIEGVDNVRTFFRGISDTLFGSEPQALNDSASVATTESSDTLSPPPEAPSQEVAPPEIINKVKSEYEKGPDSFKKWALGLSMEDRSIVGKALQEGAKAALAKSAMDSMSDEKRAMEDRAREDKKRRGMVTAVGPSAFTPRPVPGGLIASAKGV